jgi:hypothetical protein
MVFYYFIFPKFQREIQMPKLMEIIGQKAAADADDATDNADQNDGEKAPPRKITKNVRGEQRNYVYVKSVKSMKELENFGFRVIVKNKCLKN